MRVVIIYFNLSLAVNVAFFIYHTEEPTRQPLIRYLTLSSLGFIAPNDLFIYYVWFKFWKAFVLENVSQFYRKFHFFVKVNCFLLEHIHNMWRLENSCCIKRSIFLSIFFWDNHRIRMYSAIKKNDWTKIVFMTCKYMKYVSFFLFCDLAKHQNPHHTSSSFFLFC